jgi:hypothetical protein
MSVGPKPYGRFGCLLNGLFFAGLPNKQHGPYHIQDFELDGAPSASLESIFSLDADDRFNDLRRS